jgi:hypothetical protein
MRVDTLKFVDLDNRTSVYVAVLVSPTSVACSIIEEGLGDIEFAFEIRDCEKIVALFEEAIKSDANSTQALAHCSFPLTYRFKNLDGGEEAAFLILPINGSLELTLERSDEGELKFRISFDDAKRLIDTLKEALKLVPLFPPN